jgi:NitT/TauT family transport system ATP-binding protein
MPDADTVTATAAPLVRCADITVEYATADGPIHAAGPLSLSVDQGEFVSVIGPSGCGKSTLLKVISGLVRPAAGAVYFRGERCDGQPLPDAGIVFQDPLLLDWRSVLDNVLLQADVRRLDRRRLEPKARELLTLVGLDGFLERRPYELSGGMQQRVSICRALLHQPSLVLMDEPFGALDALTREKMAEELARLWRDLGMTVLFVTHSIQEAVFLSTRVIVMSSRPGRIIADIPIELESRSFHDVDAVRAASEYVSRIHGLLE